MADIGRLRPSIGPLAAVAMVSLTCGSLAQARGRPAPCRVGQTLFHQRGIRAFEVQRVDTSTPGERLPFQVIEVCLPGERRPQTLFEGSTGASTTADSFAFSGGRLGFLAREEGGVAADSSFGWVNLRTRVVKVGLFNVASPNNSPSDPTALDTSVTYVIAADGAVALIGTDGGNQQEVLVMRTRPRSLGQPKDLFFSSTPVIKADSLAINARTVTWTTTDGLSHSAPR